MMSACIKKVFGIHLINLCNINHMNRNVHLKSPGQHTVFQYCRKVSTVRDQQLSLPTLFSHVTSPNLTAQPLLSVPCIDSYAAPRLKARTVITNVNWE